MNLKLPLSAALASLLFAAPVLASEPTPPPAAGQREWHGRQGEGRGGFERMEERLNLAVERGHLTRAQADGFIAEGKQLRADVQVQRQASGGKLSDAQRQQVHERRQALREKVRSTIQANRAQHG